MDKCLDFCCGSLAHGCDLTNTELSPDYHTLTSELSCEFCALGRCYGHLRRAMDNQVRCESFDQGNQSDILYDDCVNASSYHCTDKFFRLSKFLIKH
mmetsp:Transcript_8473/g.34215  ORF Transcript_8473/g.34215 Transcript_8473/m.34215 type:complete len:97 (-) Transcript_8473:568-858(-)